MKFRSILYGSGKAGNIVGAKGFNGEYTIRVHVPHINDPNTVPQQQARKKASLVTKSLSPFAPFAKALHLGDGSRTGWSNLVKWNLAEAIAGTWPNLEFDYSKATISQGSVDLPYSPSATADGTTLSITWADNSGLGNAQQTDKVVIAALNADKRQLVYNIELADRNERNATLTLPTAWSGDTVNVWMCMRREGTNDLSRSTHLGAMPL